MTGNTDLITGNSTGVSFEAARFELSILQFEEVTTLFIPTDNGDGERGVGDSIFVKADLFEPDTGEIVATKEATYTAIRQGDDGDIVAEGQETITFLEDGDRIFTSGQYNQTDNEAGETSTLGIVGGTGDYENVKGLEFFTQTGDAGTGLYDSTFVIVDTPYFLYA